MPSRRLNDTITIAIAAVAARATLTKIPIRTGLYRTLARNRQRARLPLLIPLLAKVLRISREGSFVPPAHAEVLVVTHVLELPRDLLLPDNFGMARFELRDDVFVGWSRDARAGLIGLPPPTDEDTSPVFRAMFRRINVRTKLPLEAADAAFEGFIRPLSRRREWWFRRMSVRLMRRRGFYEWVTVVAASRFVSPSEWPADVPEQMDFLRDLLDESLTDLNRYIVALSLARNDVSLTPIAVGDIPALCPVILETAPMPTGRRDGISIVLPVHAVVPNQALAHPDPAPAEHAAQIARSEFFGGQPFFLFLELMQRAGNAWITKRLAQEIIELGTAMEVLFSTVIRESSALLGDPQARAAGILAAPLRSQVSDHLDDTRTSQST
jgi:hypothetical protein